MDVPVAFALKLCIEKRCFFPGFFFYFRKTSFFRAKDATVLVHRGREQTTIGYTVFEDQFSVITNLVPQLERIQFLSQK